MRKGFKYRYFVWAILIAALGLLADGISKILVNRYIPYNCEPFSAIPYLFDFTHIHNTGAAFSLGADTEHAMTIFIVMTSVCSVLLVAALLLWGKRSRLLMTSLSLILAGALGNLVDRIRFGYVDDFIRFAFWDSFATFNIADCCVCIGAALFVVYFLFFEGREERKKEREKHAADGGEGGDAPNA